MRRLQRPRLRLPGESRAEDSRSLYWAAGALAVVFFFSLAFELFGVHNPLGGLIITLTSPIVRGVGAIGDMVMSLGYVFRLKPIAEDNVRLENENAIVKHNLAELEAYKTEVERLRKLLRLPDIARFDYVSARIAGRSLELWFDAIWIDRGQRDGIAGGDLVVNAHGLVGEVTLSERSRSKVRLILNPDFAVGAITSVSGQQGVIRGGPRDKLGLVNTLDLGFVPKKNRIKVGEKVFTSGLTPGKPRGVYIGDVSKVVEEANRMTQRIEVTPGADVGSLEEVSVILYHKSAEDPNGE